MATGPLVSMPRPVQSATRRRCTGLLSIRNRHKSSAANTSHKPSNASAVAAWAITQGPMLVL